MKSRSRLRPNAAARPSERPRRVLVALQENDFSSREVMRGVSQYSQEHGRWEFANSPSRSAPMEMIHQQAGAVDGVIARVPDEQVDDLANSLPRGYPLVTVMNRHSGSRLAVVTDDERSIAEVSFNHFREIGLRNFAFVGQYYLDAERLVTFAQFVEERGYRCDVIAPESLDPRWSAQLQHLSAWLARLVKPVGVLTFDGPGARTVAAACQEAQLRVPEEVAILASDDALACEMAWPPISVIDMARQRMGWEAAAMLDRLMAGESIASPKVVIHPRGIIRRRSTDMLAVGNATVTEALRFVREHVRDGIKPEDVLARVNVSRSYLEQHFKASLGRTIHQEITRSRIQLTREMLAATDLPLPDIAARCGYSDRTRLSSIFRRETGMTPKAYRRQARLGTRAGRDTQTPG